MTSWFQTVLNPPIEVKLLADGAKSDKITGASGYCALLGFNLRQMMRYLTGQAVVTTPG